jgi:hypothetical protein
LVSQARIDTIKARIAIHTPIDNPNTAYSEGSISVILRMIRMLNISITSGK